MEFKITKEKLIQKAVQKAINQSGFLSPDHYIDSVISSASHLFNFNFNFQYELKREALDAYNQKVSKPKQFVRDDIYNNEDTTFTFYACLAGIPNSPFVDCETNHDVASMLVKAGVLTRDQEDSESGGFGAYFKNKKQAYDFIDRLNQYLTENWKRS